MQNETFKTPTPEEIDAYIAKGAALRAQTIRKIVVGAARAVAGLFERPKATDIGMKSAQA